MPYYDLERIKMLVREGLYRVTLSARQDALAVGVDADGVRNCVLTLDQTHFYKSMPAEKVPGLWQDVYRLCYQGVKVYLKLQIYFDSNAIVISFKQDTGWV